MTAALLELGEEPVESFLLLTYVLSTPPRETCSQGVRDRLAEHRLKEKASYGGLFDKGPMYNDKEVGAGWLSRFSREVPGAFRQSVPSVGRECRSSSATFLRGPAQARCRSLVRFRRPLTCPYSMRSPSNSLGTAFFHAESWNMYMTTPVEPCCRRSIR